MRTLLHLSDLHFGRVDTSLVEPLVTAAQELRPDLLVVSGDFTQRARRVQYRAARAFLLRMPRPQLVVPGNHDIPLWDIVRRFANPLGRYRHYISDELMPYFQDDEIAVLGLNTARSLTRKYGRINERQIEQASALFAPAGGDLVKVVVTHHPFDLPPGSQSRLVGRAAMAMRGLAAVGVDLILSGHLHLQHVGLTAPRYNIEGYSALVAQTGTTISTRGRGEANSFNVIRIAFPRITVEHHEWHDERKRFEMTVSEPFVRDDGIWRRAEKDRTAAGA